MKFTSTLWKYNITRMARNNWWQKSRIKLHETPSESILLKFGKAIVDAKEVTSPKKELPRISVEFLVPKPLALDHTHPDWKETPAWTFNDTNLLLLGIPQAQLLLKTVIIDNELPENVTNSMEETSFNVEQLIHRSICNAAIFDAHQELLPKRKDPERPAWNFPRDLGITDIRRTRNICQKFIHLCEMLSGPDVVRDRNVLHDGIITLPFHYEFERLLFTLTMDLMITSRKPLNSLTKDDYDSLELPNIHPAHPVVNLAKTNVYKDQLMYPYDINCTWPNVHTIFAHFDRTQTKNNTELPVQETQILSRALVKSFTAAAAYAKQKYGDDVGDLPESVTIQCVNSDGKMFHFSVFQLNTLVLNDTAGKKNYWWSKPRMQLYEKAQYENGKPTFEGYNPEVFRTMLAFYKNQ